jgi:hypothetical protein
MSFYMYFCFFLRYVAPFNYVLLCYTLYNIISKICIQNLSVLYVISHKNCRFCSFSTVSSKYWFKPVQTSPSQLPIFRPKNRTGPDLRTLLLTGLNITKGDAMYFDYQATCIERQQADSRKRKLDTPEGLPYKSKHRAV